MTQSKASVQKLNSKQLTEFLKKSEMTISSEGIFCLSTELPGANFICLVDVLSKKDLLEEPVLIVGKDTMRLEQGAHRLAEIIESYKIFKQMNADGDFQDYVTAESVDFM